MNSKFLVLSAILFFNFGCAHSADVAKTDMPEDDMIATAPAQGNPTMSQGSRAPASVDQEDSTCHKDNKKDCNH